jgi:hypothetical protein
VLKLSPFHLFSRRTLSPAGNQDSLKTSILKSTSFPHKLRVTGNGVPTCAASGSSLLSLLQKMMARAFGLAHTFPLNPVSEPHSSV